MKRLTISQKLYAAFGTIIVLVVGFVGFSLITQFHKSVDFTEYRTTARESLMLGDILGDIFDARISVLKFRLNADAKYVAEVKDNAQKMYSTLGDIQSLVEYPDHLKKLEEAKGFLEEYENNFYEAFELQKQRNTLVVQMDELGPSIRKNLSDIMDSAYQDGDPTAAFYAGKMQESVMLARLYAGKFLLNNAPNDAVRFLEEHREAVKQHGLLMRELNNQGRRTLATTAKEKLDNYTQIFSDVKEVIEARNDILIRRLDSIGPEAVNRVEYVLGLSTDKQNTIGPKIASAFKSSETISIIVSVLMLAVCVGLAVFFGRYLSSRLRNTEMITASLADGELDTHVDEATLDDEIGSIHKALEVFKQNRIEAEELAARQKEEQAKKQRRVEKVDSLINLFQQKASEAVSTVASAATELTQTANHVTGMMDSASEAAKSGANSASETTTNVETVAAAAEQMSGSVSDISSQMHHANQLVSKSVETVVTADSNAKKMTDSSEKVKEVVNIIADIAGQINLLALNATIESARAGEAGKGFAVVAGEIKNLASQTNQSIEEIDKVISEMGVVSDDIVGSLGEIKASVESIFEVSGNVAAAVEEQSATTDEIAGSMLTAAQGAQQITDNIKAISESTTSSREASSQVSNAALELSTQAEFLDKEVKTFLSDIKEA